jgi:iron(II)-dependent oxidoreductase
MKRDAVLAAWVRDARQRTLEVVADLSDEQLLGPQLRIVNPLLWEIGHVTWFQEKWALRHAGGAAPIRGDGDSLYDSAAIPHDTRWSLPLPSRADTLAYMMAVRDRVLERIEQGKLTENDRYFIALSVFHEDMHTEAFTYTRQTHGWTAPAFSGLEPLISNGAGPLRGDAEVPGGRFLLGAGHDEPFVFDNEKWAHAIEVRPFAIARAAVTQAEFAEFEDTAGENSGVRRGGAGARASAPSIPCTGSAKQRDGGCGAISISGWRWSRTALYCTSTGGRPRPTAIGLDADCRPRPNGKWLPRPNRHMLVRNSRT